MKQKQIIPMGKNIVDSYKMQLRTNAVVLYKERLQSYKYKSELDAEQPKLPTTQTYSGVVKTNTKRRIRKAVQLLNQISEWQQVYNPITSKDFRFRLNFITLTIPLQQELADHQKAYKQLLKPFIQTMQRVYNLKSYIWKAELQKNGQIHYHITSNTFIRFDLIRRRWNTLLQKNGYLKEYHKKHNHYNPNSTDVHKVYNDENIEAYLEKYISKENKEGQTINGKVWDCSYNLKAGKLFTSDITPTNIRNIDKLNKTNLKKEISEDYFNIFFYDKPTIKDILDGYQHTLYKEHLQVIKQLKPKAKTKVKPTPPPKVEVLQALLSLTN